MLCFNVVLLYFAVLFRPTKAVTITNTDYYGIQTGTPFTITWADASGPVTVVIRSTNGTNTVAAWKALKLWSDNLGTSFVWTPTPDLPTGPYRIELADTAVDPIYSPQFTLTNVPVPSSSTTSSSNTLTTTFLTGTSTPPPSTTQPPTTSPAAISPTAPLSSTSSSADPETTQETHSHLGRAIKAGICIALVLLVLLTSFVSISLLRNRCSLRKRGLPPFSHKTHKHQSSDVEMMGGRAEMSGAIDNCSIVGNISRDTSTRDKSRGGEVRVVQVNEVPVEIGSSGFGKLMSESEKKAAVEVEAVQRVKFEERKKRRRRVKMLIGSLRVLL